MGTNINWKSLLSKIKFRKSINLENIFEENYSYNFKMNENINQENNIWENNTLEFEIKKLILHRKI